MGRKSKYTEEQIIRALKEVAQVRGRVLVRAGAEHELLEGRATGWHAGVGASLRRVPVVVRTQRRVHRNHAYRARRAPPSAANPALVRGPTGATAGALSRRGGSAARARRAPPRARRSSSPSAL